jgi:hypothetical protein
MLQFVRILGLACGLLACNQAPSPGTMPDLASHLDLSSAPPDGAPITMETVVLTAQAGSGQSGTAVLSDNANGTTTVKISTTGGTDVGMQPAHIHVGVCGSNGPVWTPLASVQGGMSTMTVPYALSALTGGKYYINIHNSAMVATIQSCGNIQ